MTVRFAPNESGNFTGTVQVGITGGQGSVSSPPMVGVAHKIELSPAELNFGIVFVDSTREQKLTVKNQGVTTVPLTVSTEMPFSVESESSFTLASSESREVTVQLSPTASGDFQGRVRLTSGTVFKELPVTGKAYTEEEYREMLRQSILATCQATEGSQGARNIQFVPGLDQDFLFYRMPCPTEEELEVLLELLMAPGNESQPDIVPEQFSNPENIIAALNEMLYYFNIALQSLRSDPNATPEDINTILKSFVRGHVDELLQNYPGFKEFYAALISLSPQLSGVLLSLAGVLASIPGVAPAVVGGAVSVLGLLYSVLTMQPPIGLPSAEEWQVRQFLFAMMVIMAEYPNGKSAIEAVIRSTGHQVVGGRDSRMEALQVIVLAGIATQAPEAQQAGLTAAFYNEFLEWIAVAYGPSSRVNSSQLQQYMKYLMTQPHAMGFELYANAVGGFIAFVALGQNGWDIVGGYGWSTLLWSAPPKVDPDLKGLHVVATNIIDGRRVTVFVHVEAKLGVSEVGDVAGTIAQITAYARWWVNSQNPTNNPRGTAVTVLIAFNVEPGAIAALEQKLNEKNLQTPVLILYPEGGEWKARCVGDCSDKQFLDAVAVALAQALGTPYTGGNENTLGELLQKLEQAVEAAQAAYPGYSDTMAFWLAYGVCGGDIGCILFLAEQIAEELERRHCTPGGACPQSYPRSLPARKPWKP